MKIYLLLCLCMVLSACGPSKNTSTPDNVSLDQSLQSKNRVTISLLNRIRQMPGVIVSNGVPVINKTSNSLYNESTQPGASIGSSEPLYVLNGYIVGSSFRDIDQLVDNTNVKEIIVLTGSDASEYGSRGQKE